MLFTHLQAELATTTATKMLFPRFLTITVNCTQIQKLGTRPAFGEERKSNFSNLHVRETLEKGCRESRTLKAREGARDSLSERRGELVSSCVRRSKYGKIAAATDDEACVFISRAAAAVSVLVFVYVRRLFAQLDLTSASIWAARSVGRCAHNGRTCTRTPQQRHTHSRTNV